MQQGGWGTGGELRGERGGGPWQRTPPSLLGATGTAAGRACSAGWPEARPSSSASSEVLRDVGRKQTLKHAHGACCLLHLLSYVTLVTFSFGYRAVDGGHSGVHILPREPPGGPRVRLLVRVSAGRGTLLCRCGVVGGCVTLSFGLAPRRSSRGVFPRLG